jgi:hypothetical protein
MCSYLAFVSNVVLCNTLFALFALLAIYCLMSLLKMSNKTMASELSTALDDYDVALQRAEMAELLLAKEQQDNTKLNAIAPS